MSDCGILFCGKNQANRGILILVSPMLASIVEIHVHLTGIRISEFIHFQIDDHQTTQPAMKEDQIYTEPLIADSESFLPSDKSKVSSEFEQERFEMSDDSLFQFKL